MTRLTDAKALEPHNLWLRYDNGTEGTVDLSDYAGRGVFEAWADSEVWQSVRVTPSGSLEWRGELDLCGDALYMRLTGQRPEDVFSKLRAVGAGA